MLRTKPCDIPGRIVQVRLLMGIEFCHIVIGVRQSYSVVEVTPGVTSKEEFSTEVALRDLVNLVMPETRQLANFWRPRDELRDSDWVAPVLYRLVCAFDSPG